MKTVLSILLTLYMLQGLLKFYVQFAVSYEKRIKQIESYYRKKSIHLIDNVLFVIMLVLVVLLIARGVDYLSLATGLVVGMTLIQTYFHRYSAPLAEDRSPPPQSAPIKHMSYAIQAEPRKSWRELLFITVLFVWLIIMIMVKMF